MTDEVWKPGEPMPRDRYPLDPAPSDELPPMHERCHAARDGDCDWPLCPQNRDNEPHASGRDCPLVDMWNYTW